MILAAVPRPERVVEVPLDDALGYVLARDAVADIDMPRFERSAVDGWAVRSGELRAPGVTLRIVGRVMAGQVPEGPLVPGTTMKIMTGAPLPEGADAVVMVEQSTEDPERGTVRLAATAEAGQNVSHRGEDLRFGEVVLPAGSVLDAAALGLLAMIGIDPVPVRPAPTICVIPTGDELVPPRGGVPPPGSIRESNGVLLANQIRAVAPPLRAFRPGIARDRRDDLDRFLDVGLGHDILVLSGGVSMGDLDLVGVALRERGLRVLVEKVSIKPGKPLLVGRVATAGHVCHVFGLPGNPVSSAVTFELFVRPFLRAWMGYPTPRPDEIEVRLGGPASLRAIARTQHVPVVFAAAPDGGLVATPVVWHGSGDLRGLAAADGLAIVEINQAAIAPGDPIRVHRLPGRGGPAAAGAGSP